MNIPIALILGVIAGILITTTVMVVLMRSRMVVPERSSRSFEGTCEAIE